MAILKKLALLGVIAAFATIVPPANAKSIWQELNEAAPRSPAVDYREAVQRTIFDDIQASAPVAKPQADDDKLVGE